MERNARQRFDELLAVLDAHIAAEPNALNPRLQRASLLSLLGRHQDAREQYVEALKLDPHNFTAWIELGKLLLETGFTSAARTAFTAAIAAKPNEPSGYSSLAGVHLNEGNLIEALSQYEMALQIAPNDLVAHQGLSGVYLQLGDLQQASHHRRLGYHNWLGAPLRFIGANEPVPLLVFICAACENVPWVKLVDNQIFQVTTLAPDCYDMELPPHALIFNAIGDADLCRQPLEAAMELLKKTSAPVINSPQAVLATSRISTSQRMGALPGVITPRIAVIPKTLLAGPDALPELARHGLAFPLLLRSPGFHSGKHFVVVEQAEDLAAMAANLPGDELMAIEYLNARAADGKSRKYRVMIIDGQLYPLHLAISSYWKVHYYSAEMKDNPKHQAEEATFLHDMHSALGPSTMSALERIRYSLDLDYGGIDFGVREDGAVLLFEANATMMIVEPGGEQQWDYRRSAIGDALQAARRMLVDRSQKASNHA